MNMTEILRDVWLLSMYKILNVVRTRIYIHTYVHGHRNRSVCSQKLNASTDNSSLSKNMFSLALYLFYVTYVCIIFLICAVSHSVTKIVNNVVCVQCIVLNRVFVCQMMVVNFNVFALETVKELVSVHCERHA